MNITEIIDLFTKLAKAGLTLELQEQVVALREDVMATKEENLALREKNHHLSEQLAAITQANICPRCREHTYELTNTEPLTTVGTFMRTYTCSRCGFSEEALVKNIQE